MTLAGGVYDDGSCLPGEDHVGGAIPCLSAEDDGAGGAAFGDPGEIECG
jgi:hypothetical protein